MTGAVRAFLDASVLYPVSLRNLLMRLTLNGLFQARWSADVHEEWIRAVPRDRPDLPRQRLLGCGGCIFRRSAALPSLESADQADG